MIERLMNRLMVAGVLLVLASPAYAGDDDARRGWGFGFSCATQPLARANGDIVDVAVSNPNFTTLVTALQAAGLDGALRGDGPFTVFAPTNAAFAGLPSVLLGAALSDPQGLLTSILTYHVVPGRQDPRLALIPREVETLQGQGLFLSASRRTASVNQSNVACQGIRAKNGIIWVIDSVLLPQFPPAAN